MKNELTEQEKRVILNKGTEAPFGGEYYDFTGNGTYLCKQCGAPLYRLGLYPEKPQPYCHAYTKRF